jgi:hypothetical protein
MGVHLTGVYLNAAFGGRWCCISHCGGKWQLWHPVPRALRMQRFPERRPVTAISPLLSTQMHNHGGHVGVRPRQARRCAITTDVQMNHDDGADAITAWRRHTTTAAKQMHDHGVLLSTGCGACYVGGSYERHLVEVYGVKGRRKRVVVEELAGSRPRWQRGMDGLGSSWFQVPAPGQVRGATAAAAERRQGGGVQGGVSKGGLLLRGRGRRALTAWSPIRVPHISQRRSTPILNFWPDPTKNSYVAASIKLRR